MKVLSTLLVLLLSGSLANASGKAKLAREAVEYAAKNLGLKIGRQQATALTAKVGKFAARYGDDFLRAVRTVGPTKAFAIAAEKAGGKTALRLVARYGKPGMGLLRNPKSVQVFAKYGDDAARAMIRHPGIATPIIQKFGKAGVGALKVSPRNARRMAIMSRPGGVLSKHPKIVNVIAKKGDSAASWVWSNRVELLASGAALAFVANPEQFLSGSAKLVSAAGALVLATGDAVVKPVLSSTVQPVAQAFKWLLIGVPLCLLLLAGGRYLLSRRQQQWRRQAESETDF